MSVVDVVSCHGTCVIREVFIYYPLPLLFYFKVLINEVNKFEVLGQYWRMKIKSGTHFILLLE